jgi:cysteinyl-tRNA synthetase
MNQPSLQIYNTLSRLKEPFAPIEKGKIRMYVCGMTVYDYCHVGHARVMVVFDMVARYLRARGNQVTYVRNITDIDDKIIKRAAENGEEMGALTERFIKAMNEDAQALGVIPPDTEPRATTHIDEIKNMIAALMDKGYAYKAANGDVYYRVRKFENYGALSGKSIDDLRVGARVDIGEEKEDPLDFALWKAAKPGEPQWAAPWAAGRPGWHIECSAMSTRCLGAHFDIHGGGRDLTFPHHENEIAQSEAATGETFVNTWMHVGFVRVDEEKMSKSLGNFFTVREVLKKYPAEVVRYFILASHYRSPLDYSDDNLNAARSALDSFYIALRGVTPVVDAAADEHEVRFHDAMHDDFNTPKALAELFSLQTEVNRAKAAGDMPTAGEQAGILLRLAGILGLLQQRPEEYLKGDSTAGGLDSAAVDALIAQRLQARKDRNWAESDRIRDELKQAGIVLEDGSSGTTWRRA